MTDEKVIAICTTQTLVLTLSQRHVSMYSPDDGPDFPDLILSLYREVTRERNSRLVTELTAACGATATICHFPSVLQL